jgi:hypothetical protein
MLTGSNHAGLECSNPSGDEALANCWKCDGNLQAGSWHVDPVEGLLCNSCWVELMVERAKPIQEIPFKSR